MTRTKKAGPVGSALVLVAGGGSHHPAGKAGSALTWRMLTLVLAPEKHPEEMRFGLEREARTWVEPTWGHATPVTEALHVSLHLKRVCCADPAGPPPRADTRQEPRTCRAQSPGSHAAATAVLELSQRFGMGPRKRRGNVSPRVASGGPIQSRLALGNSAVPALCMPRSDAREPAFPRGSDAHYFNAGAPVPSERPTSSCSAALDVNVL